VIRVAVTGAESTGKSTLAERLAAHFGAPLGVEFARTYAERVGRRLTADDVALIARGQRDSEDDAIRRAPGGLVILDTDLLSTMVYATYYYGSCPERGAPSSIWCANRRASPGRRIRCARQPRTANRCTDDSSKRCAKVARQSRG